MSKDIEQYILRYELVRADHPGDPDEMIRDEWGDWCEWDVVYNTLTSIKERHERSQRIRELQELRRAIVEDYEKWWAKNENEPVKLYHDSVMSDIENAINKLEKRNAT